jgi:predicted Zn-dependent protease
MFHLSRASLLPVLGLAPLLALEACARNPVTGDLQLALISEAQEIQMGQQASEEVAASIGLVDDPELQQYVNSLGQTLAAASERPQLPWSFAVVDDPTPNAFALPGGPIFITRGLLGLMGTEAQLVTVLGHEIGHVTARHHVSSLSRQQLAQIGLGVGGILFPDLQQIGNLAGAGLQLLFLSHSREAERQADELGFGYSLGRGYDVREMAFVFESLQRYGEDENSRSAVPSWLMTHPAPAERIENVQARLAELTLSSTGLRIGRQEYLDQLEGLVYGVNPRDGFFRDELFLHPELEFQFNFPLQWRTQNLSQAVIGVSPQQNAAIQLTLAEGNSPGAAAQQFLSQQGIQPGQVGQQMINGLQAVVGSFRAQTEQGVVQGLVAFLSHGGRVYQLLSYTSVGGYAAYESAFTQSLRSFRPLTDPSALSAQPNRIDVVRTTEAMTLTQFNQRYPSVIPIDELAVVNQLTGPEAILPGGSLIKRVVAG